MDQIVDLGFCQLHPLNMDSAVDYILELTTFAGAQIVVTPNMDHAQRLSHQSVNTSLQNAYADASLSLCDSRILQKLIQWSGLAPPPVVTGSNLTEVLFERVLNATHEILILGGSKDVFEGLKLRYPTLNLQHHNPSMGFIRNEDEINQICELVRESNADFIFIALGSPQQEILAQRIKQRGIDKGVLLCIGASLLFLTGHEKRAPEWMQLLRMEWFYRLSRNPGRLAGRYFRNFLAAGRIYLKIRSAAKG
ncbi:WecB/TagA/CpsF family glycosyltransferase [Microbulbifer hainanensis]|uniref:WecB/TagA/CpsF family glycosyltransferase n=1 Tax=Microbulbifer hainanensis TaxID=2735675 RepID=UPI0018695960|nr:WecB/TagA/CpsF family glycosyltransferase [Microbulbifer hainanensis]